MPSFAAFSQCPGQLGQVGCRFGSGRSRLFHVAEGLFETHHSPSFLTNPSLGIIPIGLTDLSTCAFSGVCPMLIASSLGALMERMEKIENGVFDVVPAFHKPIEWAGSGGRYWAMKWPLESFLGSAQVRSLKQRVPVLKVEEVVLDVLDGGVLHGWASHFPRRRGRPWRQWLRGWRGILRSTGWRPSGC